MHFPKIEESRKYATLLLLVRQTKLVC